MAKIEVSNGPGYSLELESESQVDMGSAEFQRLVLELNRVARLADYTRLEFGRDGRDPLLYSYVIEARDGREWRQTMRFDRLTDPLTTFDVSDEWRRSEFNENYPLRQAIIELNARYKIIKLEVTRP